MIGGRSRRRARSGAVGEGSEDRACLARACGSWRSRVCLNEGALGGEGEGLGDELAAPDACKGRTGGRSARLEERARRMRGLGGRLERVPSRIRDHALAGCASSCGQERERAGRAAMVARSAPEDRLQGGPKAEAKPANRPMPVHPASRTRRMRQAKWNLPLLLFAKVIGRG